jgi:antitoxin component of RelBE/YafQ-DinJ toxin-antitoxin module
MTQTDWTVRIDGDLAASGEELFRSLGTDYSAVFSALVRTAVRQGRIPFDAGEPEPPDFEYSPELEAQDPYFDRTEQAELWRRIKDGETRGGEAFVRFDPTVENKAHV